MSISKTRQKLVDVARQLFAKNGIANTTMNDIAVASGKGRRTLYTYFMPDYLVKNVLEPNGVEYRTAERMEDVIGELDVLYMTRVQKERFFNEQDYIRLKDSYILDKEKMKMAKSHMIVLHPLPRVNEIAPEVDDDPRAAYFKQVKFGMYARMALISKITGCL